MEFGFAEPTRGALATPSVLSTIARRGEELGFGFIAISDHVVIPRNIESRYPYSETGEFAAAAAGECLDQLTMLSFLAGQTTGLKLVTSVMVLPHRSPVLTAKMLATIDVLSEGRLIVGCGVGWMREEFEALGAPPYDERGAVGDEYIRVFKELWTSDKPEFEGKYASFSDITFAPKPVQKPHPPIWIGGESPPAMRRAARLGDGWYPIGNNPRHPLRTIDQLTDAFARLHTYAEDVGRDPADINLGYSLSWVDNPNGNTSGERPMLTGSPEQVAEDIRALEDLGVRYMRVGFEGNTLDELLGRMERFADAVMPLASGP